MNRTIKYSLFLFSLAIIVFVTNQVSPPYPEVVIPAAVLMLGVIMAVFKRGKS